MLFVIGYCSRLKKKRLFYSGMIEKAWIESLGSLTFFYIHVFDDTYPKIGQKLISFRELSKRTKILHEVYVKSHYSPVWSSLVNYSTAQKKVDILNSKLESIENRELGLAYQVSRIENPGSRRSRKFSRISMTVSRKRFHSRYRNNSQRHST